MFWSTRNLRWSSARMHFMAVICLVLLAVAMPLMCAATATEASGQESAAQGQDFEVRYLSGEPDYKSVNLTWEVEPLDSTERDDELDSTTGEAAAHRRGRSFNVYYCEMQNWGPHRCRSKTLTDDSEDSGNSKQYTMTVKNLRMATKYSFHVKPQVRRGDQKASGRSEQGAGLEDEFDGNAINQGQTIVIPTKGFSAHATQCLPHASEIEVQTGPFFGGRIGSENGQCGIQGDGASDQESYIMRIDHEKCGSRVNPSDLTVETSITVQENLGILTHSTRRFVVVCTFQPDTLTVRARLALPSKGKGGASVVPQSEWWPTGGRNARVRQFNMVDKSSLVLKGSDEEEVEDLVPAKVEEVTEEVDEEVGSSTDASGVGKQELSSKENEIAERKVNWRRVDKSEPLRDAKYARLFESKNGAGPVTTGEGGVGVSELETSEGDEDGFSSRASDGDRSLDLPGLLISACLAVIMIGAFVYVLQKEFKKQRIIQQIHQHQQMQRPPAASRMPTY